MGLITSLSKAFKYLSDLFYSIYIKLLNVIFGRYKDAGKKTTDYLNKLGDTLGEKGRWMKELAKSGIAEYISELLSPKGVAELIDRAVGTVIALAIFDFLLTQWYNKYWQQMGDTTYNGALPPDVSFNNLKELMIELIVFCQLTDSDELSEFFTEGLSNSISELLEKQLVGGINISGNLLYGSEPMDDDEVKDLAENRAICEVQIDYETCLSGLYNTSGASEKAQGRYWAYKDMINQIHNDIIYHNMRMWEAISYPADLYTDQIRAIYKNILIDAVDELYSEINKYETQLKNLYALLCSIEADICDYTDEEWKLTTLKTRLSYQKQINRYLGKIDMIYQIDVYGTAENYDEATDEIIKGYDMLVTENNKLRKQIIDRLITAEQELYILYYNSSMKGYENIKRMRTSGSLDSYDIFKNRIGRV